MTLKRKLETGIVSFLRGLTTTILEQYNFYEASEAKDRKFPGFVVKASGESEIFTGGAPRNVGLEIMVMTQLDDNEEGEVPSDETRLRVRDGHDKAMTAIEAALEAPGALAALQAALNSGASKRPVSDFHLYDITKTDESPVFGDRIFADSLAFDVVCQNCDG